MVNVAVEMERQGFKTPLLIGGATTSRLHTAIKIEEHYSGVTVHVLDASKSVHVASALLSENEDRRQNFVSGIRQDYQRVREERARRSDTKKYLPYSRACENRTKIDWKAGVPPKPNQPGIHTLPDLDLATIREYIDWTPFFISWQLSGKYPDILQDPVVGEEASKLKRNADELLDRIISEKWLGARAVFGLFPANSSGDDVIVQTDNGAATLHFLRQQRQKAKGKANYCLADFIAPQSTKLEDHIGAFAVTTGFGIDPHVLAFQEAHDDYNAIMLKALADRLAEAATEWLHEQIRKQYWGYEASESLSNNELIAEVYNGIRPAPGYPACPDHTEKDTLWQLLDVENRIGMQLTESRAMYPASSVSGWFFAHPDAHYFGLGNIQKDQAINYAERKKMPLSEVEKWLRPNLNYDPGK